MTTSLSKYINNLIGYKFMGIVSDNEYYKNQYKKFIGKEIKNAACYGGRDGEPKLILYFEDCHADLDKDTEIKLK